MIEFAIQTTDLVKVYKEGRPQQVRALDGLNVSVRRGEIFGLLGRNGAGKTTLLRILTTLIRPSGGKALVMGMDVQNQELEVRSSICAVLQENALETFLSVRDNLTTYARFHSVPSREREQRALRVIERFGLGEHMNQKAMDLSGGLKRRLQVAKMFMVEKPVVFLDEATTGMDPINKRAVMDAIREEAGKGRTILLTTHILQEAEELCDTIALINNGTLAATGDLNAIKALVTEVYEVHVIFESMNDEILRSLKALRPLRVEQSGNAVDLRVSSVDALLLDTLARLSRVSPILHLEVSGGTLEDAFIELLGNPRQDVA